MTQNRGKKMTYDEAVGTILVEYYQLGDFPGWTMTDPDSAQMRRNCDDGRYEFIELTENWDGGAVIHHDTFRLDDYSEGELWFFGSAYYETKEQFESQGADVIAECVFEQLYWNVEDYGEPRKMVDKYLEIVRRKNS